MSNHTDLKDIVYRAIDFNYPTHPPLFFRTNPEHSEIVQIDYHAATNFIEEKSGLDEWGCMWENVIVTGAGYVTQFPLAELKWRVLVFVAAVIQ